MMVSLQASMLLCRALKQVSFSMRMVYDVPNQLQPAGINLKGLIESCVPPSAGRGARRRWCARSLTRQPSRATACPGAGRWWATRSACAWSCRPPSLKSGSASEAA